MLVFQIVAYLRKPLDLYIKRFSLPFHLVHLPERSGLIRARLHGAKIAKGKVCMNFSIFMLESFFLEIFKNRLLFNNFTKHKSFYCIFFMPE